MSDPIKVGIIRCDTHGVYYGALMARHDPLKLQRPVAIGSDPPHSWMNGAVHYYFYGFCADARQMTVPSVQGFKVVNVWDEDREVAETFADVLIDRPHVCDSFEQVSDDVDLVLIGDCNGDGGDHLKLATPGLKKSVPTFIDKPLANDVDDARSILGLSEAHGAPVFSASILRHLPGAVQFRSRLAEIGHADSGFVRGGGCHIAGQIHAVSLAQAVFGNGIHSVCAMGPGDLGVMHLSWGDQQNRPASGVVLHHNVREKWHCSMHVSAYGPGGAMLDEKNINDWTFPLGAIRILELVRQMVQTGQGDDSINDMIEAVAAVNAGRVSMREGARPVNLIEARKLVTCGGS